MVKAEVEKGSVNLNHDLFSSPALSSAKIYRVFREMSKKNHKEI